MKRMDWGWLGLGLAVTLTGCFREARSGYQGYVEGDFVNVATSEPGRLDRLVAKKGGQVEIGAPLFVLESASEAAIDSAPVSAMAQSFSATRSPATRTEARPAESASPGSEGSVDGFIGLHPPDR